ncbi:cupin domain-containing protein [Candidatus Latescibacterota bacterium]
MIKKNNVHYFRWKSITIFMSLLLTTAVIFPGMITAGQNGEPALGRTEQSKYTEISTHDGAGTILFQELLGYNMGIFESNFLWVHRCRIPPKSGIGLHLQRYMEDMFWAFNAPAEYTVNGKTALLPPGSSVLCPMGSYHGIYNSSASDTLEFINIAVSLNKHGDDIPGADLGIIDFGDNLENQTVESPAPFAWSNIDRSLLKPVERFLEGKGSVFYRRLWDTESFRTPWESIDHFLLPPGTSVGESINTGTETVYYIISGNGDIVVNGRHLNVRPHDAIPATLGDSHEISNNSGGDLEFFIMTIGMKNK